LICEINGNAVLAGVTSWGIGCARAGSPGEWAKVSNYLDWINNNIPALETTPKPTPLTHTSSPSTPSTPSPTPLIHTTKSTTPKTTTRPSKPTSGKNLFFIFEKIVLKRISSAIKSAECHRTSINAALAENPSSAILCIGRR